MSESTRGAKWGSILLGGGLFVFVFIAWFVHNFERVERTVALPPIGEAAWNPLYLLKQTLHADGIKAESRPRFNQPVSALGPHDTLVLLDDPRYLNAARADELLGWVERGGHLVVRTPPGAQLSKHESLPLLDALGLEAMDQGECEKFQVPGEDEHVEFCGDRRFVFAEVEPELSWGNLRDGYVYARLKHGRGHVDVLADVDFLGNGRPALAEMPARDGLRDVPHQVLARQILAPNYGKGTVHLVYAVQMPSLWRTLVERGWPVWAPLLLALFGGLWASAQRFGPLQPAPAAARRSLLEHVRASGEHLYRYGKGALLYAAARQAFLARLRRRDPVAAALTGEAQAAALAERFGLPAARLQRALQVPSSRERRDFADRISLLMHMRNRL
ncbi:protein of unknown function [Pseudoxanthomonas sp. GM95]|uniref:DUF4350 domain-containing protein n=1 Tax=Pseudoxanthomonas sp. GM95 TaxID=1881043 RepID=UPI0008CF17ED|nr:DUF4350 domain-containing protein [Pseudoxanthomonas sp. GM95]SEM41424.1 protein of unknown function [Pseudoxanthomonas sp. GM95]